MGAQALYGRSVLKQRKLPSSSARSGRPTALRCLDLGSDNGVVSLLLRERGGSWASGDLTAEAVASIRSLVETDVHLVDAAGCRSRTRAFDRVAVVDMLEHAPDEAAFARELARVTRPRRPAGREHAASQAHAAAAAAPRARPDRREARPPAPRLHAASACASCWRPPSSSRATAPTRASSRRPSTRRSTGASSGSARRPPPRAWW